MFSNINDRTSDLPVEVEVLLHSTDTRLRHAALRLAKMAAEVPLAAATQHQFAIFSLPGGGAPGFARFLASVACKQSGARLVYAAAGEVPKRAESATSIMSVRKEAVANVLLGPFLAGSTTLPQSCRLSVSFAERTPSVSNDSLRGMTVLEIPPLAARRGDSLLAADLMVRNFFPPGMVLSEDARELIADFRWPGEIAHLRVTLGVAAQRAFASGVHVVDARQIMAVISRKELNLAALCRLDHTGWSIPIAGRDLLQLATFTGFARVKKALELLLIEGAVACAGGSATGAARQLGLPYTTLVSRQKALRGDANG